MNTHIVSIIIKREYLNRVKKKSFLIVTFVVPVLFAAICVLPSLIMYAAKEEAKTVAVVDASGIVLPYLNDTESAVYADYSAFSPDTVKAKLRELEVDALLNISALNEEKTLSAELFSEKPLGMDLTESINDKINDAVEAYRVESYEIEDLDNIMKSIKADVKITSYTIGEDGKETVSETGVYMIVSMLLGMIIYMFIALFGGMVMSSVIEEKASRVVEVLVSSVKATELMFGKIIGVALVAVTQFALWIILAGALTIGATSIFAPKMDAAAMTEMAGMTAPGTADIASVAADNEASVIFSTLGNLPLGEILICFFVFFIFGYLLYASLFAAIGSAVENEADTQQLQIPLTIPLLLGFFIALYAFKAPDSAVVFWGSMIPFTSPIVMIARIPFGVATWEIILSAALLIVTFAGCAYVSSKIYKVGILMFGKKSTWKDLWKWLKLK